MAEETGITHELDTPSEMSPVEIITWVVAAIELQQRLALTEERQSAIIQQATSKALAETGIVSGAAMTLDTVQIIIDLAVVHTMAIMVGSEALDFDSGQE